MRTTLSTLLCAAVLAASAADRRAPGFSLMDTKGAEHDLADYHGKLVLLAFVQTTCPHCAALAENMQQALEKFGDKIAVLAVVDPPDDPVKARDFSTSHKLSYPVLFDSGQMAYSYVRTPNLTYPHLYLIDGNGMIKEDLEYGPLTKEVIEGNGLIPEINRVLNGSVHKAVYYRQ